MLVTQTIDHHKETIFTKWVQLPGELMENPGGVCGVLPATCRARPLRSAASASQAIDHLQETILAKWAQHSGVWGGGGGRSWKIWLVCAVCFLKPEGCTHCVLFRAPRRLLTITRKRSSLSGLNTQWFGWGAHGKSGWRVRLAPCNLQGATIAFYCERLASY